MPLWGCRSQQADSRSGTPNRGRCLPRASPSGEMGALVNGSLEAEHETYVKV